MNPLANMARWLVLQFAICALWLAAFGAARLLEYAPHASLWFPPTAVTFAALLVFRWHGLPGLLLAGMISTALANLEYDLGLGTRAVLLNGAAFAAVHCAAYGLTAWLVARSIERGPRASMPRAVIAFVFGGLLGALIAAIAGAWVTYVGGMLPRPDAKLVVVPWLIGDYAGLLAAGPLLVVAMRRFAIASGMPMLAQSRAYNAVPGSIVWTRIFTIKLCVLLGLTAVVLSAAATIRDYPPVLFVVFFAIVLQLWIVHTEGATESLVALAAFSLMTAVATAVLHLQNEAFTLQFALITLAAGTYFGLAVPMLYADNARLRQLLIHDQLTGAYSRRFFEELAARQIVHAREAGKSAALVMIDLDHLKRVNDRYGHAAGDQLLRNLARCCRAQLGPGDLLGRLGGDEFCLFLPEADHQRAVDTAQRIAAAVQLLAANGEDSSLLSASFGAASIADGEGDYETLLARADRALYAAKRGGRGRVAGDTAAA